MALINRSRYAVLGMLSLGAASGYEVRQRLAERVAPYWQESYGQIYPLLARLLSEGMVEVVAEDGRGRTFALTGSGRAELVAWLASPPIPERGRNELLLKTFLGTEIPRDVLSAHVWAFREQLVEELKTYRVHHAEIIERNDDRRVFSELTVTYGMTYNEAMIGWCDTALQLLDSSGGGEG